MALASLALLASALAAGFFYTWSATVIPGLSAGDPVAAIGSMNSINAAIRTPVFAFSFFGGLAFPLAGGAAALWSRDWGTGGAAWVGAAIYGLGVIAVTFAVSLPLNEELAGVVPTAETARQAWTAYADRWLAWNHVRSAAATIAFAFVALAFALEFAACARAAQE